MPIAEYGRSERSGFQRGRAYRAAKSGRTCRAAPLVRCCAGCAATPSLAGRGSGCLESLPAALQRGQPATTALRSRQRLPALCKSPAGGDLMTAETDLGPSSTDSLVRRLLKDDPPLAKSL